MASLEDKLILLGTTYGRHPYEINGKHGFFSRDEFSDLYPTLEEAIAAEAHRIRNNHVVYKDIEDLRQQMKVRDIHLGILEN